MYKTPFIDKVRAGCKYVLKSSSIGRWIYPFFQSVWRRFAIPARIRRLHRVGYGVLADMDKVFQNNQIPYYCDCGTLIGFMRDGGFIKHDDDIDVCVLPETVPPALVLKAFLDADWGFVHGFSFEGHLIEVTVKHQKGVTVDIFFHRYCVDDRRFLTEYFLRWYPDRAYPSEHANTALKYRLRGPDGLTRVSIHGVEVSVPTNADEVLTSEYGPWKKPDPNFKSEMIVHEEQSEFAYRLSREEALRM